MTVKLVVLLAAVLPVHHHHEAKPAKVHKPHRKLGPHFTVQATAYTPCSSGSRMADGHSTYWGAVAVPRRGLRFHQRMHTLIRLDHPLHGRRLFRARDWIGSGSQLDVWMPSCSGGVAFGRQRIGYRVVSR